MNGHVQFPFVMSSAFPYFCKGVLHQLQNKKENEKRSAADQVTEFAEHGIVFLMNCSFQF